jgi:hypothetical protein
MDVFLIYPLNGEWAFISDEVNLVVSFSELYA